jgi:hypothetical protein
MSKMNKKPLEIDRTIVGMRLKLTKKITGELQHGSIAYYVYNITIVTLQ